MELTITLQADSLSAEALQRVTSDLCRALNREADVQAAVVEKAVEPGAKCAGQLSPIISMVVPVLHHGVSVLAHNIPDGKDVFTHASGIVLGESFLKFLKTYFERHPALKATLQNAKGREVVLGSEDLEPDHVEQTANKVNAILSDFE